MPPWYSHKGWWLLEIAILLTLDSNIQGIYFAMWQIISAQAWSYLWLLLTLAAAISWGAVSFLLESLCCQGEHFDCKSIHLLGSFFFLVSIDLVFRLGCQCYNPMSSFVAIGSVVFPSNIIFNYNPLLHHGCIKRTSPSPSKHVAIYPSQRPSSLLPASWKQLSQTAAAVVTHVEYLYPLSVGKYIYANTV